MFIDGAECVAQHLNYSNERRLLGVTCTGHDFKGNGGIITYNQSTQQTINATAKDNAITCVRVPTSTPSMPAGNQFYSDKAIIVTTTAGGLDIFWPQDSAFPIVTASTIQTNINALQASLTALQALVNTNQTHTSAQLDAVSAKIPDSLYVIDRTPGSGCIQASFANNNAVSSCPDDHPVLTGVIAGNHSGVVPIVVRWGLSTNRFMHMISSILVALVAIEHSLIMAAEMWFWHTPWVMKRFNPKPGAVECPAVYAANQGLYNGFLAAGLFWSILTDANGFELKIFFLGCVLVAGIYGAVTVKPQILLVQAVPAGLALVTTWLGR